MASTATIKVPVSVEIGGKRIEIGTLEIDVKVSPGGRIIAPSSQQIRQAMKRVK